MLVNVLPVLMYVWLVPLPPMVMSLFMFQFLNLSPSAITHVPNETLEFTCFVGVPYESASPRSLQDAEKSWRSRGPRHCLLYVVSFPIPTSAAFMDFILLY